MSTAHRSEAASAHLTRAEVLRRLELQIVRRLDGRASGDHRTAEFGPGSERAGAREYQPGDDARKIDWNLTARNQAVHVRTTEADRELQTWVVADRSASLDFGTGEREKRDVVLGAAAAFGVLTARAGNRFGVTTCGGPQLVTRPAGAGRTAMLAGLATIHDTPRYPGPPAEGADLESALEAVRGLQPRRGHIVVISDFLDGSGWARGLRRLTLRHQVTAVQVVDPRELDLPDVGLLTVADPETGRLVTVQTRSGSLRDRYREAAAERATRIRSAIRAAGAEHVRLSTGGDWLTELLVHVRRRRQAAALGGLR